MELEQRFTDIGVKSPPLIFQKPSRRNLVPKLRLGFGTAPVLADPSGDVCGRCEACCGRTWRSHRRLDLVNRHERMAINVATENDRYLTKELDSVVQRNLSVSAIAEA